MSLRVGGSHREAVLAIIWLSKRVSSRDIARPFRREDASGVIGERVYARGLIPVFGVHERQCMCLDDTFAIMGEEGLSMLTRQKLSSFASLQRSIVAPSPLATTVFVSCIVIKEKALTFRAL